MIWSDKKGIHCQLLTVFPGTVVIHNSSLKSQWQQSNAVSFVILTILGKYSEQPAFAPALGLYGVLHSILTSHVLAK